MRKKLQSAVDHFRRLCKLARTAIERCEHPRIISGTYTTLLAIPFALIPKVPKLVENSGVVYALSRSPICFIELHKREETVGKIYHLAGALKPLELVLSPCPEYEGIRTYLRTFLNTCEWLLTHTNATVSQLLAGAYFEIELEMIIEEMIGYDALLKYDEVYAVPCTDEELAVKLQKLKFVNYAVTLFIKDITCLAEFELLWADKYVVGRVSRLLNEFLPPYNGLPPEALEKGSI